jgi:hypothetical protein
VKWVPKTFRSSKQLMLFKKYDSIKPLQLIEVEHIKLLTQTYKLGLNDSVNGFKKTHDQSSGFLFSSNINRLSANGSVLAFVRVPDGVQKELELDKIPKKNPNEEDKYIVDFRSESLLIDGFFEPKTYQEIKDLRYLGVDLDWYLTHHYDQFNLDVVKEISKDESLHPGVRGKALNLLCRIDENYVIDVQNPEWFLGWGNHVLEYLRIRLQKSGKHITWP